jgi:multidrug efflux pump subunit AcrA (membrane-fusion protein)
LVNLQALYRGDRTTLPRAELAQARAELAAVEARLARITEALLDSMGEAPATFVRRARELEAQHVAAQAAVQAAERALAEATRADITGADDRWRALAQGVEALDYAARVQARQLVVDTFERIVVHWRGIRPGQGPAGGIDVVLLARGGTQRMLRLNKAGQVLAVEDVDA